MRSGPKGAKACKRAEPKKATKKVAMKEPNKKAKPGGKQRTTGS